MLSVLYAPWSFFRDREPGLTGPAIVVAAVIVVSTAGGVVRLFGRTAVLSDAAAPGARDTVVGATLVGGVIGLVLAVAWLLFVLLYYAAGFHGLSSAFDGQGSFGATLAVAGWGFLPKLLAEFVNLLAEFFVVYRWSQMDALAVAMGRQTVLGPLGVGLLGLVPILVVPWSAYIWYHGVKEVRGVDATGAAVSVGVPVALALVFDLAVVVVAVWGVMQV